MTTTAPSNTTIRALMREAQAHGDDRMAWICSRALDGAAVARATCARVIAEAQAQADAPEAHDLRTIIAALERGDGCPIARRDAHHSLRDLVAACEDADLEDPEDVAELLADARERLAEVTS